MNKEDFMFSNYPQHLPQQQEAPQTVDQPQTGGSGIGGYLVYILIGIVIILLIALGYMLYNSSNGSNGTGPNGLNGQNKPIAHGHPVRRGPPVKAKKMPDVGEAPETHQPSSMKDAWSNARTRQKQKVELARSLAKQKAVEDETDHENDQEDRDEHVEHGDRNDEYTEDSGHVVAGQSEFVEE